MYIAEFGYDVKSTTLQFKDIDTKQGIVIGYFSAFGIKDWDGEILVKGAFKKSIVERGPKSNATVNFKLKHLLDHNRKNTVAVLQDLEEDEIGLRYESKAGRHTAGQDWLKMCEDGIITEHSTGTIPSKNKSVKKPEGTIITETYMIEGSSLQAWGANPGTPVVGFKNLKIEELKDRFTVLEKAMRNGTYTDETFIQVIEPELKHIERIINNFSAATTEPEPLAATIQPEPKDEMIATGLKSINKLFKN
jgi:HK97 family phage prohead protease